ncbi:hypothetical protein Sango_1918900 [Sesamum angolense]|uniref:Uncharacterized protein n=1 Tax=Sesamum angolense TaxID=2727404 RepID=A0AAE1WDW3_9LAMI|nr:hypothetical protein Sango_1918900 [Sesamum angolense]
MVVEKNMPRSVGPTSEFQDGATAFIEWPKSQHAYMDGEKIKRPYRKCKNKVFKIPDEDYFDAVIAPPLQEEQAPAAHKDFVEKLGRSQPWSEILTVRRPCTPFSGTCSLPLPRRAEPRNVRLGLCMDGFAPHGQYNSMYLCWPIILTPYNLPLGICMSSEYMFLKMVFLGPSNLKHLTDVYLGLLIKELQNL